MLINLQQKIRKKERIFFGAILSEKEDEIFLQ